jgi:hypothetical protein
MNKMVRSSVALVLVAGASFLTTGCAVECHEETDPKTGKKVEVCEAVTLTRFEAPERAHTLTYARGSDILIDGTNGDITVQPGGADQVYVTFSPFTMAKEEEEDAAKREMEDLLVTEATDSGGIVIRASRKDGSSSYLGADISVTLPTGYTGGVTVDVGNGFLRADLGGTQKSTTIKNDGAGDLKVDNAAGKLDIVGDFEVDVSVAKWGAAGETGSVRSSGLLGKVSLAVPTDAKGRVQATSKDGVVTGPSPLPSGWEEEAAADNSKTFTFGGGSGANVTCDADEGVTISAR